MSGNGGVGELMMGIGCGVIDGRAGAQTGWSGRRSGPWKMCAMREAQLPSLLAWTPEACCHAGSARVNERAMTLIRDNSCMFEGL